MPSHEVLIGVTGGVAAYKTAALVSRLVQSDIGVSVVMTRSAQRFVGRATFEALTGRPVCTKGIGQPGYPLGPHIQLAQQAQLLCVAPATANFLAKAAHGIADDLLSTLYLSCTCPVLIAPAMNNEMWNQLPVQRNVQQLAADGVQIVAPQEGWLSCRSVGPGRMAEPEQILQEIQAALAG
ncbi:MAG: phosphopantothenoylcysteine decarboxylase [Planctomycetales bacterium]|nr:phosphopantothenoylcysteine decarboxylase [Planctomycetales bacterium]NIM08455.1 phosphopantothenoylcysteine decarboxylase [Planctomycetales bacterium]NIN07931.1 phosphopantothenoylcysteine decarboxylase [Planctomycetales bacterium]NIN77060.1 phosphopantothenoylcysteine decarboxylase [Planctomycetales bacterium]NIO34245.1 phosphopantothenoylcysteine decarboxylase [Planctomycetales bacterium]